MTETNTSSDYVYDIEIAYSVEELAEKLHQYKLLPKYAYSKVITNKPRLISMQKALPNDSYLFQLCEAVKSWDSQDNATLFTTNINYLIFLWISSLEQNESTQSILEVLQCLHIKPGIGFSRSSKFHAFLTDLLIETMQKYHLETLDYMLHYDENLHLPNATQIVPKLESTLSTSSENQITALLSLHFQTDSNHFLLPKETSITLNKHLATTILKCINEKSQLYFSGDSQFDIIIPEIDSKTQFELTRVKIFGAFEETILVDRQSILVKPFIGCSYSQGDIDSAHVLFENAKLALEHAIKTHQYYVEYSDKLEQFITDRIVLESKVLEAFDSNSLILVFQPIVETKRSICVGAEILLRWPDQYGESISPGLIIEVLDNAGKGKLFARWLINSACRYAHQLTKENSLDLYLTINLRAEDLHDPELPALFSNALSLWKINPKHLILEITENGILEESDDTNAVINALSDLGFKFALDDFGTGFSSLTRLRQLPIDLIKIDQSFVKNIDHSKEDYKIVRSIAMLADSLGKEVLAEGIEDEACLALIKKLNITKCQGYHFSKPLSYEEFTQWVGKVNIV